MKELYKASSIIERDALLARLREAGIACESPARDMSRKVTHATVDLSLGGYSVFFDGFPILILERDEEGAGRILESFLAEGKAGSVGASATPTGRAWDKFYFSAIFSILFPLILSVPATYHLYRGWKSGERPAGIRFGFALFCFLTGWSMVFVLGYSWL